MPTSRPEKVAACIPRTIPSGLLALLRACYWMDRLAYNHGPLRAASTSVQAVIAVRKVPADNAQILWYAIRQLAARGGTCRRWTVRLEWEPQDSWIGVFWKHDKVGWIGRNVLDVWVCLLPMVPIHLTRQIVAPE